MSMIMIRCPETDSKISTGIECEDDDQIRSGPSASAYGLPQSACAADALSTDSAATPARRRLPFILGMAIVLHKL
jgi:hypothetical protein